MKFKILVVFAFLLACLPAIGQQTFHYPALESSNTFTNTNTFNGNTYFPQLSLGQCLTLGTNGLLQTTPCAVGNFLPLTGGTLSGALTDASGFIGPVTGNVTGNATGLSGTPSINVNAVTAVTVSAPNTVTGAIPAADPIYYGADPTGAADSAPAINSALTATAYGSIRDVVIPAGTYHVKSALTVAPGQCLVGQTGWGTIIDVSTDFSTSASGVVVVSPTSNQSNVQACVRDISFRFHQPADASTTSASTVSSGSTLTVANGAACVAGDYLYDDTAPASIQSQTTITISSNTFTLSKALAGTVTNGDVLQCAPTRSSWTTLAQGCSLTAGAPGCKYPWAIYNNGSQTFNADHILISDGWDGIYQRGQTYNFNYIYSGTVDQALNQDAAYNFPQIDNFEEWNFHVGANTNLARDEVYYDGSNVCANLGESDGLAAGKIQCWIGKVNLTANFSWGQIAEMQLDGNFSDLNIASTYGGGSGWLQVGSFYKSGATLPADTAAIYVNASGFHAWINNADFQGVSGAYPNIYVNSGNLAIDSGLLAVSSGTQAAIVAGGSLELNNTTITSNGSCPTLPNGLVQQTGGILIANNNLFSTPTCAQPAFVMAGDNLYNSVQGNTLQSWTFTPPGTQGTYANNNYAGVVTTQNSQFYLNGATFYTNGAGAPSLQTLALYDSTAGSNPYKYLRVNGGHFQIANSAFSAILFDMDDVGNTSIANGTNVLYYCSAGVSAGNMCRGTGCSCVAGTWTDTGLRVK